MSTDHFLSLEQRCRVGLWVPVDVLLPCFILVLLCATRCNILPPSSIGYGRYPRVVRRHVQRSVYDACTHTVSRRACPPCGERRANTGGQCAGHSRWQRCQLGKHHSPPHAKRSSAPCGRYACTHARTYDDRVTSTVNVVSKRTNRPQIREPRADAILPDFQLTYCQDEWEAERASWCMVIQLNLVRGINFILDLLAEELAGGPYPASADSDVSDDDNDADVDGARFSPSTGALHLSGKHRLLKLRLAPLRTLQRDLEMRIGIQAGADLSDTMISASPPGSPTMGPGAAPRKQEFFVRSSTSWKQVHGRTSSEGTLGRGGGVGGRRSKDIQMREAADILAGCADDMKAIWEDASVREMLLRKGIRMETTPGLCVACFLSRVVCSPLAHWCMCSFLNDIDRIASRDYEPSDDDVVRARLRTLGVQEHKIKFTKGASRATSINHVGGMLTLTLTFPAHAHPQGPQRGPNGASTTSAGRARSGSPGTRTSTTATRSSSSRRSRASTSGSRRTGASTASRTATCSGRPSRRRSCSPRRRSCCF